jgi:hypothetical protein
MSITRSMSLLMILAVPVVRAPAGEPVGQFSKRDAAVLEAVLKDYGDAANPIHANFLAVRRPGQFVVLDSESATFLPALALDQGRLNLRLGDTPAQAVSKEIGDDLRRRNSEAFASLKDFRPKDVKVTVVDIEETLADVATPAEQYNKFWELYPDSWGLVYAYLPGYSKDGTTAVVPLVSGPSMQMQFDTYFLKKEDGRWKVEWRQGHSRL